MKEGGLRKGRDEEEKMTERKLNKKDKILGKTNYLLFSFSSSPCPNCHCLPFLYFQIFLQVFRWLIEVALRYISSQKRGWGYL